MCYIFGKGIRKQREEERSNIPVCGTFPFPKIGLEFSAWIPVPEKWEWNLPFPVPEVQKSFPLMAAWQHLVTILMCQFMTNHFGEQGL